MNNLTLNNAKLNKKTIEILEKLDLGDFINNFLEFFSRMPQDLFLQGDLTLHLNRINELANINFNAPPKSVNTDFYIQKLSKMGICHLDELFYFAKMINYINYLKRLNHGKFMDEFLQKIQFGDWVFDFINIFDEKGELKSSVDENLSRFYDALRIKKQELQTTLRAYLTNQNLTPYLMDNSLHLQKDCECLLVRAGFDKVIKANIISRSSSGGFYIEPKAISSIKDAILDIKTNIENIKLEYAKKYSKILSKNIVFIKFLDKTYTLVDSYVARASFAKSYDLEFVMPKNDKKIILKDFAHPNLSNPKKINVDFDSSVLLITGVNAGGKSMLLKSILSASFLCKHLIPMRINAQKSSISVFNRYHTIISDPQDSKNDISTFAGRMKSFASILNDENYIVGIDEIELGTDFEEACNLFYVLINKMMQNNAKIIITTHHKRLALMLSANENVSILAALFNEKTQMPKYEFLSGSIGKSYAYETAYRYGIPANLVNLAKQSQTSEQENLEAMINKSIELDLQLKKQLKFINSQKQRIRNLVSDIKEQKIEFNKEYKEQKINLQKQYLDAINEAKKTIDLKDTKQKQRQINKAWQKVNEIKQIEQKANNKFFVGDIVKYGNLKGEIISLNKDRAYIKSDFGAINANINTLILVKNDFGAKKTKAKFPSLKSVQSETNTKINYQKANVLPSIDLHGLRGDEALEKLDKYISDALLAGYDEVVVYHGIGTGRLAFLVREFLKEHKSVREFFDADNKRGGSGAKIVRF